jgi:hypothetical protein
MPFEMQPVPGVAGTIMSEVSLWRGLTFIVNGRRLKPRGIFVRRVSLPGADGPVEGKIKGGLPGTQQLIVEGNAYPTGPPVPKGLQVVAALPVLLMLLIRGGGLGLIVAIAGVTLNSQIVTSTRPNRTKVALMVATLLVGASVNIALAVASRSAWWQ